MSLKLKLAQGESAPTPESCHVISTWHCKVLSSIFADGFRNCPLKQHSSLSSGCMCMSCSLTSVLCRYFVILDTQEGPDLNFFGSFPVRSATLSMAVSLSGVH